MNLPEKFWSRTVKVGDCLLWTGALTANGYGSLYIDGRHWYAHRAAYVDRVGPIPSGQVIDHLCRNKRCVRPDHLEPVTIRENTLRGARGYALTGTCLSGKHEIKSDGDLHKKGAGRTCKACANEARRIRNARAAAS